MCLTVKLKHGLRNRCKSKHLYQIRRHTLRNAMSAQIVPNRVHNCEVAALVELPQSTEGMAAPAAQAGLGWWLLPPAAHGSWFCV